MNFNSELKKGNFMITECSHCKKIVWPSSNFCNQCFNETSWRKSSGIGKIIEFSKKDDIWFCLVEIEDSIRIIGQIDFGTPKVGDKINIVKCGEVNGNMHVKMKISK